MAASTRLYALAMAVVWGAPSVLYPSLPERFPTHFGAAGLPDAWSDKSLASWFLLPLIGTGLLLLFAGVSTWAARLAERHPEWINVPDKARFVALPADARVRALAPARAFFPRLGLTIAALFTVIVVGTARVAAGEATSLSPWLVWLFLALVLAQVVWLGVSLRRSIRAELGSR